MKELGKKRKAIRDLKINILIIYKEIANGVNYKSFQ